MRLEFNAICLIFSYAGACFHKAILEGANKETLTAIFEDEVRHTDFNKKDHFGMTMLHVAVYTDNLEACEFLVEKGVNLDVGDGTGASPLFYAVAANNIRFVNFLLSKGAYVYHKDVNGRIALHIAVKYGFVDVTKALMVNSERIDVKKSSMLDGKGRTFFHYAAEGGHRDIIHILSYKYVDMNVADDSGMTPLLLAIVNNKEEAVFMITKYVKYGVDEMKCAAQYGRKSVLLALLRLNEECDSRNTWLNAIYHGSSNAVDEYLLACDTNVEIVKALILAGVDLQQVNQRGENAMEISLKRGNYAVYLLISKEIAVRSSRISAEKFLPRLHFEITETVANMKRIRELIDTAPLGNIDERDYLNRTAAHAAVEMNNVDVVKALISAKCNLALKDIRGRTALHSVKSVEMAELLIKTDPSLANTLDVEWNDPLQLATMKEREDIVDVLAPFTNLGHTNIESDTALKIAVLNNNLKLTECLLKHGAANEERQQCHGSILHETAKRGFLEMTLLLVRYGAKPLIYDMIGAFPAHCAVCYGYGENVELMRALMRGVPPDSTDMFGYSFIHYAVIFNTNLENVIKLLKEEFGVPLDMISYGGETALHMTSKYGNVKKVKVLVECGANVMLMNSSGETALHISIRRYANAKYVECVSVLAHVDRNLLKMKNADELTPVNLLDDLNDREARDVIVAMELTPRDIPNDPTHVKAILNFLSPSFLSNLVHSREPFTFQGYVERGIKAFKEDNDLDEDFNDVLASLSKGLGIFYAFSTALYFPEFASRGIATTETERYHRKRQDCLEEIKTFEKSRKKGFYAMSLRFMLVESFLNEEGYKRFQGTYMEIFPKELIEDIFVGVINNGDVLGRMELIANSLMLTLERNEDLKIYSCYFRKKMARLSEVLIPK